MALAPLAAAVLVAVVAVLAGGRGSGPTTGPGRSPTSQAGQVPGATSTSPPASGSSTGNPPGTGTASTATRPPSSDAPQAPWRAAPLARGAVPGPFVEAWQRAKNRSTCALLVASDYGPALAGATTDWNPTPQDQGWDIFNRKEGAMVEVLAVFTKSQAPESSPPAGYSKQWRDGSTARYGPDSSGRPGETIDPQTSAMKAVLTLPDQDCVYRIYDTLGLSHLESLFDHLRLVEGAGAKK